MSYNNNPNPYSNKMSYSNLSKKNQMILKLKQEIVEQKQKEDEYNELLNEVQLLESRMDNLTLEKEKNDIEQRAKNSSFLKNILDLKTEYDSIQSFFRETKIEYQELEGEHSSLSQMNEIKNNELSRLKLELKAARDKTLRLKEHKQSFQHSSQKMLREKNDYEQEILNLTKEIEILIQKNYDDEKKLQELDFEVQRNESFNFQNQKSNKSQETDLTSKKLQAENQEKGLKSLKLQIEKTKREITNLENKNEEIKQQIIQMNQNIQKEKGKEIDCETQLININKLLKKKQQELDIQDKNLDEMQDIFCKNKELGENSRNDYNVLVNHLNLLVNEKENIMNTLSKLIAEDENIAKLLEAKSNNFNIS